MAKSKKKSAEIIRLRAKRHNRRSIEWNSVHVVCEILQEEIANAIRTGIAINKIANKCNLGHNTVSRIGYGETKAPRASTCLVLLYYFGYKVYVT